MEMSVSEKMRRSAGNRTWCISRTRALEWSAIVAIVVLAAVLRLANLDALGDANHYYTAAVKAMLQSWHNFFFAAAEPGGSVSVDKPPVGLWFQVISAYFFDVNGFGVLLPQIIAGILSVILVYHLVRRSFGAVAGLLAGFALAITPVVVATDRNNTMDSTLILMLLCAVWAFIKATELGKLRYLILGSILVGIGFNIKMLQAYLPLPAFLALYFFGSPERWWRKSINLALATVVLLIVSLSWATIVDLTPADQRPYVGSSSDNSELNLITGYNGTQRLLGMGGRGGLLASLFSSNQNSGPGQPPNGSFQPPQFQNGNNGPAPQQSFDDGRQPPQGFQPPQGQAGDGGFQQPPQNAPGGPGGGPGGFNIGQAGAMRLFTAPLSKEASWLLPLGLLSVWLLVFRARIRFPIAPPHQAIVLWGGWLITAGVFFSVAGFFHEYYLSMLGAPLAALVGIGLSELWRIREKHTWLVLPLIALAALGTFLLQITTSSAYVNTAWWLPLAAALFLIGIALLIPVVNRRVNLLAQVGFACVVAAFLLTPGIWSALTTLNSSANQSLPAAYAGRSAGPANMGQSQVNQTLLDFLQANTQGIKYLMAVPSSMQGSDYVLATGRPVLYLGGFNGQDKVESGDSLAKLVANGDLRYIYWDARGGGGLNSMQSDVSSWVTRSCKVVGYDATTQNFGAPDGTSTTSTNNNRGLAPGGQAMQVSLYDCKS